MRWTTGRSLMAVAALIAVTGLPAAQAKTAVPTPCASHHAYAGWTEVDLPTFPTWSTNQATTTMTTWAADRGTPGRVFITDGLSVLRTTDFGCTWRTVYQVSLPPQWRAGNPAIWSLVAPGGNYVYLMEWLGDMGFLLTSKDGGLTFTRAGANVPVVFPSAEGTVVASTKNPKRVLLVNVDPFFLERSDDGGASWTVAAGSVGLLNTSNGYVAFDPADANTLYVWPVGTVGLYRSTDAGASFTEIQKTFTLSTDPAALGILHVAGAPVLIAGTTTVLMGCNADCSLSGALPGLPSKFVVGSVSVAPGGKAMLMASPGARIFRYNPRSGASADVRPPLGADPLARPQNDMSAHPTFWTGTMANLYFRAG
jgi:hypothetical protein